MSWITVSEAARAAGVSPDSVRRWADSGRVEAVRTPGGHRRVNADSLTDALAGRPSVRSVPPEETVAQFAVDSEDWYSWGVPLSWTVERTDEFIRSLDEAELGLRALRQAAAAHLDRLGG